MNQPPAPLIYIALSPELYDEIRFERFLPGLREKARLERWDGPGAPSQAAMQDALQRAEILVTGWGTPFLVDALRDWSPGHSPVRLVAHTAGSVKRLLPYEALANGLLVSHANETLAEAVAEFTLGAILAMRRQMFLAERRFKTRTAAPSYTQFHELKGSTVGIIGAGAIGRRVMALLRPFQVQLLVFDPYTPPVLFQEFGASQVSLEEVFRRSDIVSLHAPVTSETIRMLGAAQFQAMKDGALFVNTARGRLVDADALLRELQTGRISALLDVTDPDEPLPLDSPFFALENCVILPHIAGHSAEARLRQGQDTAEDILNYLSGKSLRFQVRPERWASMA
jgi:phosphoglycerate dehydrogenase-like enzyme